MQRSVTASGSVLQLPATSLLVNGCFLFCFLSYMRVFPIAAENQPVAAAFALFVVAIHGVPKHRPVYTLAALSVVVLFYTLVSVAVRNERAAEVTILGVGYLLPVLIFLAIWPRIKLVSTKMYGVIVCIVFTIGAIQYFEALSTFRPLLDAVLRPLFSRFLAGSFEGGRGVGMIFSEPAAAAYFIFLFFLSNIFFLLQRRISEGWFAFLTVLVVLMAYFNRSGTLFVLLVFLLACILIAAAYFRRRAILLTFTIGGFVTGAVLWAISELEWAESVRFLALLTTVRGFDLADWRDVVPFSVLAGGIRLPSILIGYGGLLQEPLGRGTGSWLTDFSAISQFVGIDFGVIGLDDTENYWLLGYIKPSAMAAAVALDLGLAGLLLLAMFTAQVVRATTRALPIQMGFWAMVFALFAASMIFLYGITLLPVPWLLFAYACSLAYGDQQSRLDGRT